MLHQYRSILCSYKWFSPADRELRKSIDELSRERHEVIRDLINVGCQTCHRPVDITKSCSDWIVQEQNVCLTNLGNRSNQVNRVSEQIVSIYSRKYPYYCHEQLLTCYLVGSYLNCSKGPLMAANMLHSVKHNIKAQYIRWYKVIRS